MLKISGVKTSDMWFKKIDTLKTDLKLGLRLLHREGFMRFFSRLIWYFRGARLREDVFEKTGKTFSKRWLRPVDTIPALESFPMVSVVIPLYNHEKFIEKAIESVQNQTYPKEKIEIIVIDDGSSDQSFERAKKTLEKGSRPFEISRQKNKGAHETINRGLKKASGKYLSILNSDDFFHPDRLKILISALENQETSDKKSGFVFSGVRYVNETNDLLNEEFAKSFEKMQQYSIQFPTAGFALLDGNIAITTGNFVFTKSLFEKIGDFRDFKFCHDWDFVLRSLAFCEPIFVAKKLYFYRFHGDNSFLKLQAILPGEVKKILTDFFQIQNPSNLQFPNEKNFGGSKNIFKKFIRDHGYQKYF